MKEHRLKRQINLVFKQQLRAKVMREHYVDMFINYNLYDDDNLCWSPYYTEDFGYLCFLNNVRLTLTSSYKITDVEPVFYFNIYLFKILMCDMNGYIDFSLNERSIWSYFYNFRNITTSQYDYLLDRKNIFTFRFNICSDSDFLFLLLYFKIFYWDHRLRNTNKYPIKSGSISSSYLFSYKTININYKTFPYLSKFDLDWSFSSKINFRAKTPIPKSFFFSYMKFF
jgi:hypothetical protein